MGSLTSFKVGQLYNWVESIWRIYSTLNVNGRSTYTKSLHEDKMVVETVILWSTHVIQMLCLCRLR